MTFRVVRTNQYNQDLGLIHSTNGNHLESSNEGSSIDHQEEGTSGGATKSSDEHLPRHWINSRKNKKPADSLDVRTVGRVILDFSSSNVNNFIILVSTQTIKLPVWFVCSHQLRTISRFTFDFSNGASPNPASSHPKAVHDQTSLPSAQVTLCCQTTLSIHEGRRIIHRNLVRTSSTTSTRRDQNSTLASVCLAQRRKGTHGRETSSLLTEILGSLQPVYSFTSTCPRQHLGGTQG
ncbi:hypothetical protein F511_32685 [Dorcoceras hygrometricum]|uniref:Uncharacterized protein n=1 Tax=Dorcoceras hygrometricum TaxID=472368 RepID=A0A2Z7AYV0_9LAMI|nr:hypothetical protein F511_32685 [Dorcoceras hygrometricum]